MTTLISIPSVGSCLNYKQINTHALLLDNTIILDCGFNVLSQLSDDIVDKLEYGLITHHHADHCGSFEALCYHKEFMQHKDFYVHNFNTEELKYIHNMKSRKALLHDLTTRTGYKVDFPYYVLRDEIQYNDIVVYIYYVETKHVVENYAYLFLFFNRNDMNHIAIIYSGDTEPCMNIYFLYLLAKSYNHHIDDDKIFIFHDAYFSPNHQIPGHSYIMDLIHYYPPEMVDRIFPIHCDIEGLSYTIDHNGILTCSRNISDFKTEIKQIIRSHDHRHLYDVLSSTL